MYPSLASRPATLALALLVVTSGALAQTPRPAPCTAPAYRQFDFWIGEWQVADPQGKPVGRSSITSILGGCVVKEAFAGDSAYRGESFNAFDSRTRRWRQTWVDNGGLVALFEGGLRDGAMVLEGDGADPGGKAFRSRMTFGRLSDGRVRQHWERSDDGGATWTTMFDGYYSPKP